ESVSVPVVSSMLRLAPLKEIALLPTGSVSGSVGAPTSTVSVLPDSVPVTGPEPRLMFSPARKSRAAADSEYDSFGRVAGSLAGSAAAATAGLGVVVASAVSAASGTRLGSVWAGAGLFAWTDVVVGGGVGTRPVCGAVGVAVDETAGCGLGGVVGSV